MAHTVNKENTLTVGWLLKALASGRVSEDMPLAIMLHGPREDMKLIGVDACELHTFGEQKVIVLHTETERRPVAEGPGEFTAELFG